MSKHTESVPLTNRVAMILIPGLFAALPLVFDADLYRFALLPKQILLQIALLALTIVWIRDLGQQTVTWSPSRTFLPATLFFFWSTISVVFADLNVFGATTFLSHQITFYLLFVVVSQVSSLQTIDRAINWSCVSGILFSLIGILEFWGVDISAIPSNGRPSSTFAYRNFAASYLVAILPLVFINVLRARARAEMILASVAALCTTLFLVYTRSRGAWLGAATSLITFTCLYAVTRFCLVGKHTIIRTASGRLIPIVTASLLILLLPWSPRISAPHSRAIDEGKADLLDAMGSLTDGDANRGRWHLWSRTLEIVSDHPITGVGMDNWKLAYPAYDGGVMIKAGSAPERPHNDLLWIASETGMPGVVLYGWLLLQSAVTVFRMALRRDENALIAGGLLCGLIAIVVHGFFGFPRERIETSFFFWSALGLIHGLSGKRERRKDVPMPLLPWLSPAVLGLCVAITLAEIRFDRALLAGLRSFAGNDIISTDRHSSEGLRSGPFDSRVFLLRNKVYQAGRNYLQAQAACLEGLNYHPNSVELLGDLGMNYALGGDLGRARDTLLKASELAPSHHQIQNNLGGVYQRMDDRQRAERAYRRATEIKIDYPDAWSNLGLLHMVGGKYDEAVSSFTRALEFTPNDPVLHHNLADALYVRASPGDRLGAVSHYGVFLKTWRGDIAETAIARSRVTEIGSGK